MTTADAPATPCHLAACLPPLAAARPDQVAMRCPGRDGAYDLSLIHIC